MLRFSSFLILHEFVENQAKSRSRASSFSDEHAFAHVWNHGVATGSHDTSHLTSEVAAAKKDPNHPLSFESRVKSGAAGFVKGTDLSHPDAKEHYHRELDKAASTVGNLINHPDFAKASKAGHKARVAGADKKGELSDRWKSRGATDNTSKSDVHIGSAKNPTAIRMSYKDSRGSQLASAGPQHTSATIEHASNQLMASDRNHTPEKHNELMNHVKDMADHMNAARSASNEIERSASLKKAQVAHAAIANTPGLAHHIAHEAGTGEGQFGKGSPNTATHVVSTYNPGTKKTKVIKAEDFGGEHVDKMRISKGKGTSSGKYRTHVFRMDLKS